MPNLRKTVAVALLFAGSAFAAASPMLKAPPDLCFASGTVTYRLSSSAPPDYRVAIDNSAPRPDLRVRLVDQVDTADFALTDDAGTLTGNACRSGGAVRTVRLVAPGAAADLTIAVSPQRASAADLSLYVHSARGSHHGAAALFALVRQAPDASRELDGGPDHVAALR